MLASAVFAFETTLQPFGMLPLLGGCAASYMISSLLMRNSIMTEKIARRGIRAPGEYVADALDQAFVTAVASRNVQTIQAEQTVEQARQWLDTEAGMSHQGYPVLNQHGVLVGVVTRRNISDPALSPELTIEKMIQQPVRFVYEDCTVRQAADHMVNHRIGRLPVVTRARPHRLVGIITRSDILSVFQRGVSDSQLQAPTISIKRGNKPTPPVSPSQSIGTTRS